MEERKFNCIRQWKNVYPEEIENYILGIQYVQEVVVKGKKNKIGQEVALIAEVFLNEEK